MALVSSVILSHKLKIIARIAIEDMFLGYRNVERIRFLYLFTEKSHKYHQYQAGDSMDFWV